MEYPTPAYTVPNTLGVGDYPSAFVIEEEARRGPYHGWGHLFLADRIYSETIRQGTAVSDSLNWPDHSRSLIDRRLQTDGASLSGGRAFQVRYQYLFLSWLGINTDT